MHTRWAGAREGETTNTGASTRSQFFGISARSVHLPWFMWTHAIATVGPPKRLAMAAAVFGGNVVARCIGRQRGGFRHSSTASCVFTARRDVVEFDSMVRENQNRQNDEIVVTCVRSKCPMTEHNVMNTNFIKLSLGCFQAWASGKNRQLQRGVASFSSRSTRYVEVTSAKLPKS